MHISEGLGIVGGDIQLILALFASTVSISTLTSIVTGRILVKSRVLGRHIYIAASFLADDTQGTTHEEGIIEMPLDGKVVGNAGIFALILLREHRIVKRVIDRHARIQAQGWILRITLQLLGIVAILIKWGIVRVDGRIVAERAVWRVLRLVAGNLKVVLECQVLVLV